MIIEHKLTIKSFHNYKLPFIKILKDYTNEGLKECKWVSDLLPSENYFEANEFSSEKEHIKFIKSVSNFDFYIKGDYLTIIFKMHSSLTNKMNDELKEIIPDFNLDGLAELREEKLKGLLD